MMTYGGRCWLLLCTSAGVTSALRYDASHSDYNLNQNGTATNPLDYWGEWEGHSYTSSPDNWRFPFYTVSLDRYANGDPSNDEANGTAFEHDWMSNQFRFGGDVLGLMNDLDYIHGMGIKAIYIMGSPFINQPWMADGYSPLDFTLLDAHHGTIDDWRALIDAIHDRDMYILLDNTMSTMGDLLGFQGHQNETTPFSWDEYDYVWKSERRYFDFEPGYAVNESCVYPRFWDDDGYPMTYMLANETRCRDSEFSFYGDLGSTGHYPVYETQLSKYASVQDRLREWRSGVLSKIKHFSCIQIAMLDIDGFRMDKGLQTSVDAMSEFTTYQRECAREYGKENFLIIGEVVGTEPQAAIYVGRGRQADQYLTNLTEAITISNASVDSAYVRDVGMNGLDGPGFNYAVHGALTRFLGLDGDIGHHGVDFIKVWQNMTLQYDMINVNTGEFDPRHLFGTTSQDVFRWPAIESGLQRQMLGQFITVLELPGAPALYWGEEQSFYLLDSTTSNYVYGRQPMSSNRGWQLHGCYKLDDSGYVNFPLDSARNGCNDISASLDHKDPSHPARNIIKRMYELRQQYPVLNDGFNLEALSNQTTDVYLEGSLGTPSPTGIWSVYRSGIDGVQHLHGYQGDQGVWLVFSNENRTRNFDFDCSNAGTALVAPFLSNTTVKNLFYPYEELTLDHSAVAYSRQGAQGLSGCLSNLTMPAWGYKAFVPVDAFMGPSPLITGTTPSHDARIVSIVDVGQQQTVPIEIRFSAPMDCSSVTHRLTVNSTTQDGTTASLDSSSVTCNNTLAEDLVLSGQPPTTWSFTANLVGVSHGIHTVTINNASSHNGTYTNAVDRFMFRIGGTDNPIVFPDSANYTRNLLQRDGSTGDLYISPIAPGAELLRYSRTWGSEWSSWIEYTGANITLDDQVWSGTSAQGWSGEHVIVQYWGRMAASSDHVQHADLDTTQSMRRWPHAFVLGEWNSYGYDNGLESSMSPGSNGTWHFDLAAEWPTKTTINVWGMNPDGVADKTMEYGDIDGDGVLDWLHPDTLSENIINITSGPGMPHLAWRIVVNDGDYTFKFLPIGSGSYQLALSILLALIPPLTGCLAIWVFKQSYYQVKFNRIGIVSKIGLMGLLPSRFAAVTQRKQPPAPVDSEHRRTVLIATMEYEIEDWDIKIKIGGLGVMAALMSKALGHQDLVWVVPCVGGVDYPTDTIADPLAITICGNQYIIDVQYHYYKNITFVLLDAPIFRHQSKEQPYPSRMDDLESAIYYSAWNACIAETIKRFPIDLYHINDYHGAAAPLYLLPQTIPVSLSLHNADFQGRWPIRNASEMREIVEVFNLPKEVIKTYIQFGEVFNLLHAGANYLRIHQKGFGAVGVSKKYGVRALKRYPIFWGLSNIGSLPNPDPSDTAELTENHPDPKAVAIDTEAESERGRFRVQAQEWAGLEVNPEAQLFVFVGRWCQQKGIDLIADIFAAVLEKHSNVQLICVGPVIDLYGKFAALKLQKIMQRYPGRVYSKPEFTSLPSYIFSGAEFALIPSRDEPFGLVAVEFGRRGALGVGSRVGGLGQMPGWWYNIESTETRHLLRQFESAVKTALGSSPETRALMRAHSSLQRFPVAQWVKNLEMLQDTSIEMHEKAAAGATSLILPLSRPATSHSASSGSMYRRNFSLVASTTASTVASSVVGSRASSLVRGGAVPPMPPMPLAANDFDGSTPRSPSLQSMQGMTRVVTLKALAQDTGEPETPETPWPLVPEEPPDSSGSSNSSSGANHPMPWLEYRLDQNNQSVLTVNSVVGGSKDFRLQNVDPLFSDHLGRYYDEFERQLDGHSGSLSADRLCVESYLKESEKRWFSRFYDAKLRKKEAEATGVSVVDEGFGLGPDHIYPRGIKWLMQAKIRDWPIYTFFLAFGQIISANSYQISLLTGQHGESAARLYVLCSIFLGASVAWWVLFRTTQSIYSLSLPFIFYGSAFFLLGMTPYAATPAGSQWIQSVASGLYAFGSASGFLFFTQNFGNEGGTPVRTWVFRACAIQGTQQLYMAALWYWGSSASTRVSNGVMSSSLLGSTRIVTAIGVPIAVLMWAISILLYIGLPAYYRAKPGDVPAFYPSLLRRKVVVWFFVVVIIQNYWLSAPYGRSWAYLWSSNVAPGWTIALLMLFFFVVVWAVILAFFSGLSREHSWALPLFAIGLGAPRWCQMLWGTSGMGLYLPWVPGTSDLAGALLGRCLWLWLGVLDTVQSVGFGMMLLQTLARLHMAGAVAAAQVLGSIFTIAARASAPNKIGPGPVFPNLPMDLWGGVCNVWLWVPLAMQLAICVGFFVFFRKEQLFKP